MDYVIDSFNTAEGTALVTFLPPNGTVRLNVAIPVVGNSFIAGADLENMLSNIAATLIERPISEVDSSSILAMVGVAGTVAPTSEDVVRSAKNRSRYEYVAGIKVTTQAGNTFDGDETSQTRMARAIIALQATNTPTVTWVLANNTPIQATAAELTEALALAGAAQAAVWVI